MQTFQPGPKDICCTLFQIPQTSLFQVGHYIMAFVFSHCQKGPGEYVITLCVACPCSPSCDHLIWVGRSHLMSFNPAQLLSVQQKYPALTKPALFPLVFCKPCPGWGLPPWEMLPSPAPPCCLRGIPTTSPCPAAPGAASTACSPAQT